VLRCIGRTKEKYAAHYGRKPRHTRTAQQPTSFFIIFRKGTVIASLCVCNIGDRKLRAAATGIFFLPNEPTTLLLIERNDDDDFCDEMCCVGLCFCT
jgi:hypothetical protein